MFCKFSQAIVVLIVVGVFVSVGGQESRPRKYPIKLDIPDRVGARYHVDASSHERKTVTTTVPGQFAQTTTDEFAVELSADVVIETVENNWATRKRFTILSSKLTKGASVRPLLPAGTVVVASRANDNTIYQVADKLVGEDITKWLRSLINLHVAGVGDDGMFGTTTPKAVAESWPVSVAETRKLLKEMGANGETEMISGTGTLERVDGNHIFVRSSVHMQDVLIPMGEFTAESGDVRASYFGRVPLSESDLSRDVSASLHLALKGTSPTEAGTIKLEYVMENQSKYAIRPMGVDVIRQKN